jgi:hypothetical protein
MSVYKIILMRLYKGVEMKKLEAACKSELKAYFKQL